MLLRRRTLHHFSTVHYIPGNVSSMDAKQATAVVYGYVFLEIKRFLILHSSIF